MFAAADRRPSMPAPATRAARIFEPSTDEALMARLAAGDRQAMKALYARHHLAVYRFALRLVGNTATAEDIVSEVFLELWRHCLLYTSPSPRDS